MTDSGVEKPVVGEGPREGAGPFPRQLFAALLIGAVGAALNCVDLRPIEGVHYPLGAVAPFVVALMLGPVLAALTAFIAYLPNLLLWDQSLALFVAVLEAAIFGHLYFHRRFGMAKSFLLFWGLVGLPLVYGVVFHLAADPEPIRWVVLVKFPVVSVVALLFAAVHLRIRSLVTLSGGVVPSRPQQLERLLYANFAPVVLAPLLFFILSGGMLVNSVFLAQRESLLQHATEEVAGDLAETLTFLEHVISDLARAIDAEGAQSAEPILERLRSEHPIFDRLLVADAQGRVLCAVGDDRGQERGRVGRRGAGIANNESFKVPMATGRPFVGNVFMGRGHGTGAGFAIAAPLLGPAGKPQGAVVAAVLLKDVSSGLRSLARKWHEQPFAVLDGAGRVLVASPEMKFRAMENLQLGLGLPRGRGLGRPEYFEEIRRDGAAPEVVIRSLAEVQGTRWRVMADLPLRQIMRGATLAYSTAGLFALLAWLIAMGVMRVVSTQMQEPFRFLARLTSIMNPAEVGRVWQSRPRDMPLELVDLGSALAGSHGQLLQANQELRIALQERDEANQKLHLLSEDLERKVVTRTTDLEVARQRAEKASREKSNFVAHMSHELRTPLNVILGSVQLLERERGREMDAANAARLRQITTSGALLRDLIEEVLDLAKIESGALEIHPERLDAAAVVRECAAMMETAAARKGLDLRAMVHVTDGTMVGDYRRLRQVLVNILNNAVKFTPAKGAVEIALRAAPGEPERLAFVITDNGIGISAEEQRRVFDPFMRGTGARATGEPGTGLGLPLVKRIVEDHRGTLEMRSEIGRGSCFTVTLPRWAFAPAPEREDAGAAAPSAAVGHRPGDSRPPLVLIAEDHAPNAAVLSDLCELEGMVTRVAVNGLEAVAMTESYLPDVVLMDWRMPLLEGPEAIQRIKGNARTAHIPIIALTAFAQREDAARMAEVGAVACLTKPIDFAQLMERLAELKIRPVAPPLAGEFAAAAAINA